MRTIIGVFFLGMLATLAVGCQTVTTQGKGTVSSAAYVGDYSQREYANLILTMPNQHGERQYNHLNVEIVLLLNPEEWGASRYLYSARQAALNAQSRVVEAIHREHNKFAAQSYAGLAGLREEITKTAQQTLDEHYQHWKRAKSVSAKLVIVKFYLSDPAAGTTDQNKPWRGW